MATGDHGNTTEWQDILMEKGIIPEITQEALEELVDETIHKHMNGKSMEDKELDELLEMEDENLEDDRVLQQYRTQRLKEMQDMQNAAAFGKISEITKPDYELQVTKASKDVWVVVILYQTYIESSNLLLAILQRLAAKYPQTKFVKIQADLCIEKYPDRNVPTLLIYGKIIGMGKYGGKNASLENVEIVLKSIGALPAKTNGHTGDSDEEEEKERMANRFGMNFIGKGQNEGDDDDWN